jgi:hypothetical protein
MQCPTELGTWLRGLSLAIAFAFAPQYVVAQSSNYAKVNLQDSVGGSKSESPSPIPPIITPAQAETPPPPDAAASQPPSDPLLFATDHVRVKFGLSGLAQSSGALGSWWNLSEDYAPDSGYDPDRAWGELWIKPAITTEITFDPALAIYSALSYVGSGTVGYDVFEQGQRGLFAVEDAYFGTRLGSADAAQLDVSYGRQQYKIGSGMLIAVGAMNGFERGAVTSFARRAWEEAGLVKLKRGKLSLEGFYLNPNELPSSDTKTRLAGAKLERAVAPDQAIGLAYLNVFQSEFPYIQAPVQLLPNGREGLNVVQVFNRWKPASQRFAGLYVAGDYAYQWNDRIAMASNGYSGEIGNVFSQLPMTPKLVYAYRSFQGDDPNTAKYEKFDPLFYEGSPPLWASGSNGSFSFLNSNVQLHRLQFSLNPTQRDTLSFYYWHIRADQINSPVQFGQAGRITVIGGEPALVSGVPDAHLSDDFYVENLRVLSPNWFLTTGLAVSVPGRGLRELVDNPETWYGALATLAFQY